MYFALLCCPLLMINALHLSSGPIVFWSECHNIVKFFRLESRVAFPFFIHMFRHSAISPSAHVRTHSKLQNLPHPPTPQSLSHLLVICCGRLFCVVVLSTHPLSFIHTCNSFILLFPFYVSGFLLCVFVSDFVTYN